MTGYEHYWFGSLAVGMRDASGLMYMRNRYYDPQTGQFTQTDPIGLAGGLNAYGFAAGDPVSFSDPYGLSAEDCCTGSNAYDGIDPGRILADAENFERHSGRDRLSTLIPSALSIGGGYAALVAGSSAALASAPTLASRAREIHGLASAATQGRTTIAAAQVITRDGVRQTWIASSEPGLRAAQQAAIRTGERAIRGSGHAEVTILNAARAEGAVVQVIAASRPICSACAQAIQAARALAASALKH